jgi:PAS domain S-box-containing protein
MSKSEGDPISVNAQPVSDAAISELLHLEQRLEAILANLAEAVTVVDERGQMVFANQAAADLLGATTPDELMRARPGTIMPRFLVLDEQGHELDLESMPGRRLFAGEHPEPLLVRNIVRATGEERWLMVRSSPIMDPRTGGIQYAVNVFENITEVKQAQLAERSRAQLYTERSRIAHILERSLLPETLPEIPGVEIATLYAPAGEVNEVGGDFYDVFEHSAGRWMLVIGDVCGKGPTAAGVTALARHTLRAAALSGQSPKDMLHTLHRALRLQPAGADLCTVCLVMMAPEPDRARLTIALAGHLPPLLVSHSGDATPVGEPGTLLGVIEPIEITESESELLAGETLLLYTDGVPEAGRAQGQLGEQGLLRLCADSPDLTPRGLLERIESATIERVAGRLRDDIALLALRLHPDETPTETAASGDTSRTGP